MFGRTIADLMKLNTLIHLLVETLAGRAIGRMEGSIVTVSASSSPNLSVTVRAGESRIKDYLLQTLPVLAFEVTYKRVVSLSFRESVFFEII